MTKIIAPSWGSKIRFRGSQRHAIVTCKGCQGTILNTKWKVHPLKCPNTYNNVLISVGVF